MKDDREPEGADSVFTSDSSSEDSEDSEPVDDVSKLTASFVKVANEEDAGEAPEDDSLPLSEEDKNAYEEFIKYSNNIGSDASGAFLLYLVVVCAVNSVPRKSSKKAVEDFLTSGRPEDELEVLTNCVIAGSDWFLNAVMESREQFVKRKLISWGWDADYTTNHIRMLKKLYYLKNNQCICAKTNAKKGVERQLAPSISIDTSGRDTYKVVGESLMPSKVSRIKMSYKKNMSIFFEAFVRVINVVDRLWEIAREISKEAKKAGKYDTDEDLMIANIRICCGYINDFFAKSKKSSPVLNRIRAIYSSFKLLS